jgi:3-oxoacyl-(acyl-carrier-protein) synthase
MTDRRRVVVTGMGMVSALGNDVATTWAGLVAGRSGIRTIEAFDPSRLTSRMAGEVRDFDASGVLDRKDMRRIDRYIQFGLVAAREALDPHGRRSTRPGCPAASKATSPSGPESSSAPGWVASGHSSRGSSSMPFAAPTGSVRS